MAALAYVLLPLTGLLASTLGRSARVRFHGLQAVTLGVLWPAALYAASALSETATKAVFIAGAVVSLAFFVLAAVGKDPRLPLIGTRLRAAAETDPRALAD